MSDKSFKDQLITWRHHLHMYPESAFEEHVTSEYLAKELSDMGLEVHRGLGGTGIVANLKVGQGNGVIGLRADIDAINLTEEGHSSYRSKHLGKMHACGHDGHMATLLGAAKLLIERKDFNGTVRFIFQPAEEPGKGAAAMIRDGLLERFPMDEIYGMHNWPGLPVGTISTRAGGIMASEDNFNIQIKGKGCHASSPHLGTDPLVIAAEIILTLQTVVSRNIDPNSSAVISCTELYTDGIRNAIPTNVVIKGDTRSYTPDIQKTIEDRMRSICEGICSMHGAECQFEYTHEFAPTYNWANYLGSVIEAAKITVGEDNVDSNCTPLMVAEDFGEFLQKIPGCFIFIGSGDCNGVASDIPLHNSLYDYNDEILEIGSEYFAELVKIRLAP